MIRNLLAEHLARKVDAEIMSDFMAKHFPLTPDDPILVDPPDELSKLIDSGKVGPPFVVPVDFNIIKALKEDRAVTKQVRTGLHRQVEQMLHGIKTMHVREGDKLTYVLTVSMDSFGPVHISLFRHTLRSRFEAACLAATAPAGLGFRARAYKFVLSFFHPHTSPPKPVLRRVLRFDSEINP